MKGSDVANEAYLLKDNRSKIVVRSFAHKGPPAQKVGSEPKLQSPHLKIAKGYKSRRGVLPSKRSERANAVKN